MSHPEMVLPAADMEQLALTLFDIGAVKLGQFRLHSGRISPIYLDLRILPSFPQALKLATAVYCTLLQPLTFDLLAAAPLAGLPLGTAVCLVMEKPLIYPRKTPKSHGTGKDVEGVWEVGQTAVIIDDLITSGDSVLEAIAAIKATGLHVHHAVVLVDREQGGRQTLEKQGYQTHAAITLSYLFAVLEKHERITAEQRAKLLQALK